MTGAAAGLVAVEDAEVRVVTSVADGDPAGAIDRSLEFLGCHPAECGQVGPLVGVWFQGCQVQEDGRAVAAGGFEQRRGDEVPESAGREQVLGGKQPVVAGEAEPAAQRHRLP